MRIKQYLRRFGLGLCSALVVGMSLADPTMVAPPEEWVLAAGHHPPWFYADRSKPVGIAFDTLNEVALAMGYTPRLHVMPAKRIYAELLKGRAHFSIALVHDERLSYPPGLLMGQERLVAYPVVGIALKSRHLRFDRLEQLKPFHVGHLMMPKQVSPYLREGFTHTPYVDTSHLIKGLVSERIDVAITATPNFIEAAIRLGVINELEIVYTMGYDSMYMVFSKTALGEQAPLAVKRSDAALRKLKETGRLAEIISRYSDISHFIDYGKSAP